MKSAPLGTDSSGMVRAPGIHDAIVQAIHYVADSRLDLVLKDPSGVTRTFSFLDVPRVGFEDVVNGQIVSDLFCRNPSRESNMPETKFTWDDRVIVRCAGKQAQRNGACAWVVGVTAEPRQGKYYEQFPPGTVYSVEFEDGLAMEIHEDDLDCFDS